MLINARSSSPYRRTWSFCHHCRVTVAVTVGIWLTPTKFIRSASDSISEENFWRNYFYRVSLLRQSYELNAMANQAENNPVESFTDPDNADQNQGNLDTHYRILSTLYSLSHIYYMFRFFSFTWERNIQCTLLSFNIPNSKAETTIDSDQFVIINQTSRINIYTRWFDNSITDLFVLVVVWDENQSASKGINQEGIPRIATL